MTFSRRLNNRGETRYAGCTMPTSLVLPGAASLAPLPRLSREAKRRLTDWLIEYNFKRPHQALGYEVPVEYHYKYQKVSPMYPSSTQA